MSRSFILLTPPRAPMRLGLVLLVVMTTVAMGAAADGHKHRHSVNEPIAMHKRSLYNKVRSSLSADSMRISRVEL